MDAARHGYELELIDKLEEGWATIVRDVRPHSNRLAAIVTDVRPVDVEGNVVLVLPKSRFHADQVQKVENRQIVEQVISEYMGQSMAVECLPLEKTERPEDRRNQIGKARRDRRVQRAINIFDAEVVGVYRNDEGANE